MAIPIKQVPILSGKSQRILSAKPTQYSLCHVVNPLPKTAERFVRWNDNFVKRFRHGEGNKQRYGILAI